MTTGQTVLRRRRPLDPSRPFTAALRRALGHEGLEVTGCRRLSTGVYRLMLRACEPASVVVKQVDPAGAHRSRLLARRWLPAVGLADACPPLLATMETLERSWTVHGWLDGVRLDAVLDAGHLRRLVDLVAAVHVRSARHPHLAEIRHHCRHLGPDGLAGQLSDAAQALAVVARESARLPALTTVARELAALVRRERRQASPTLALVRDAGGPDTLLHGDLWPQNALAGAGGLRLVDWERLAVGPACYDLSILLLRLPPALRRPALDRYRGQVTAAGWPRLTDRQVRDVSVAFERARLATLISWRVLDLLRSPSTAGWVVDQLGLIRTWWGQVELPLAPQERGAR